jgi:hypothetical protein
VVLAVVFLDSVVPIKVVVGVVLELVVMVILRV